MIRFKSKNDNAKDNPMKSLKSPPPQKPICHRKNENTVINAVKAMENININGFLKHMLKIKLKINPYINRIKLNLLGIIPNFKS